MKVARKYLHKDVIITIYQLLDLLKIVILTKNAVFFENTQLPFILLDSLPDCIEVIPIFLQEKRGSPIMANLLHIKSAYIQEVLKLDFVLRADVLTDHSLTSATLLRLHLW